MMYILESDWKVLRRLKPLALERFCERTLAECVQVATGSGDSAHERYLTLYRLVHERDKELARAFNNLRRSSAINALISMTNLDLLTASELAEFSDETRGIVQRVLEPRS
ncbi:MAG: peptide ABC transporter substrate-binding protein [Rhodocyclales bacterium]|nr:peptide ABC transporter substrate-binding protein [Rhodocyclales bacterium]